jgi:AbrB family looped-hinge helix DNA binding protein
MLLHINKGKTKGRTMTIATLKISSKGQIVIPARMRKELGLEAGQWINAELKDGVIKLERAKTIEENADYFTSLIKPGTKPITDAHQFVEENWDGRF